MEAKPNEIPARYREDWIERMDGRTTLARAVRARLDSLCADLGGAETLSYQRKSLAKRAVWMEAVLESWEAELARGGEVDMGRMTQAVNSLIGLFRVLGLDRVAREVPDLRDYLRQREAETRSTDGNGSAEPVDG